MEEYHGDAPPHAEPEAAEPEEGAELAAPEPASMQLEHVVRGGYLKKAWVPEATINVHGKLFYTFSRRERGLASYVGLESGRNPWANNRWPEYMSHLRNKAVTNAMAFANRAEIDPLADEACAPPKRARRDLIDLIDAMVQIEVPSIGPVPPHKLYVLTAASHNACAKFELTTSNLDWLAEVVHYEPPFEDDACKARTGGRRKRDEKAEQAAWLEEMPDVQWDHPKRVMKSMWTDEHGKVHRRQQTIPAIVDDETVDQNMLRTTALKFQADVNRLRDA